MKYQKEFEERFFDIDDPDYLGVDPKTGKYYDEEDRLLYAGFVAGIESGIKKKEPTLLDLVGEWRKSNISDEELLNNINNELENNINNELENNELENNELENKTKKSVELEPEFMEIIHPIKTKASKIDLLYKSDHIVSGVPFYDVDFDENGLAGWRPSAIQD